MELLLLINQYQQNRQDPKYQIIPLAMVETPKLGVSTIANDNDYRNHNIQWKPATIGVIINQYKRICTIQSRKINPAFSWHPRFHDHIIRNADELNRIQNYIQMNPKNWNGDKFKSP